MTIVLAIAVVVLLTWIAGAFAIYAWMTRGKAGEEKNVLQKSLLPMVAMMALMWPVLVLGWINDRMCDFFDGKD